MSELANLQAELADIRTRRASALKAIEAAQARYDDAVARNNRKDKTATDEQLKAAQAAMTSLETQAGRMQTRIAELENAARSGNEATQSRIDAARAKSDETRRTLLDEAPPHWDKFYENLKKDLPLPPANFLPMAQTAALFGAQKAPGIVSNWIGRAKTGAALREAQAATDPAARAAAMTRADELVGQHEFKYYPTRKDAPMIGAAAGMGALAGAEPTMYDMALPDRNQEKVAALAAAQQLDEADPRRAEAIAAAQAMDDKNPYRQKAWDRTTDGLWWLKSPIMGAMQGVAGYEMMDVASKALKFPFNNPRADIAAYNRSNSPSGAADVYQGRIAQEISRRAPSDDDVAQELEQILRKRRGEPETPPTQPPDGGVPPTPPPQPPQVPPPGYVPAASRRGAFPLNVSEQKALQSQLSGIMSNSRLPGIAIGLGAGGGAMMAGAPDASAQGVNPLVIMAIEELRRRGLLAEPDTAPGLLGGQP